MSDQSPDASARRKGRSPSYPGIDLELAIQRAGQLWEREHHYRTSVPTILGHWGYGAKSGGGFAAVAALKAFGLLDDKGNGPDREAWLTELGQDIITAEDQAKRSELVKQAALKPPIHAHLWQQYGTRLPSDTSMQLYLTRERNFTPSGAGELVSEWKRTMAYAELSNEADTVPADDDHAPENEHQQVGEPAVTPPETITHEQPPADQRPKQDGGRQERTVQVPYGPNQFALVQASLPMTEREWDQLMAALQMFKVGFVESSG